MKRGFLQRRSVLPLISLVGGLFHIFATWGYADTDGAPLFKEMGARFNELTEKHSGHPGWEEAREFFGNPDGAPGEDLLFLLGEMDSLFDLLEQAVAADVFSRPPPEAYLPDKMIPEVNEARQFAPFIWAKIHILEETGEIQEAQDLLWQFRHVFLQSLTPGTTIEFLTYSATQRERYAQMYRVLAAQRREENLATQVSFLERHPSFLEWLEPEKWYQLNSVDLIFGEDVKEAFAMGNEKLLEALEENNERHQAVRKLIQENTFFNANRWTKSIRRAIRSYHEELSPALEGSSEEYRIWKDSRIEHWERLLQNRDPREISAYIEKSLDDILTKENLTQDDLLRLDQEVMNFFKGTYFLIIMPAWEMPANLHRMLLASERLLAIELAAGLYKERHGHRPERLEKLQAEKLLGPDHLTDPLSGEFFRLRTEPSWQPYSIGVNREDNGGIYLNWQDSRRGKEGDLLLFPPFPERR
ncbi:MAG: hypothetical protein LAT55_03815 [Opitutales bacterium]|nr:hypothetical protein [Opitutales bacterium]